MPTYVHLFNWTDQGIRTFRETVDRVAAAESMLAKLGVHIKDIYWTQGPYDIIAVTESPDEETGIGALLALGAQGNVRSVTLRAFDRDEMSRVIARLVV
jgi:uncharacterized protein with GYD domain